MQVTVEYFSNLRDLTGRVKEEVEVNEGASVDEVLIALELKYGEKLSQCIREGEGIKPYFKILVNGRDIRGIDDIRTQLQPNAVLSIFPPAGGG
jgi:MoaD family protein